MSITVLLADDHRVFLDGLRLLLEQRTGEFRVVGEAVTGIEALHKSQDLKPDLVIIDMSMPELNGIDATRQICNRLPGINVIMLTMHATAEHALQAIRAGVRGYVLKGSTGRELIDAVHAVMSGRRYLSQDISDMLLDYVEQPARHVEEDPLARLSKREKEILPLVLEGKSSTKIAYIVYLSAKTVETYRSRIMKKLQVKTLSDLIKLAFKKGWVPLD